MVKLLKYICKTLNIKAQFTKQIKKVLNINMEDIIMIINNKVT